MNNKSAIKWRHFLVLSAYLILHVLEQLLFMKGQIIRLPAGYKHKNQTFIQQTQPQDSPKINFLTPFWVNSPLRNIIYSFTTKPLNASQLTLHLTHSTRTVLFTI